ncbi:DUF481 domain-containing protein [Gaopeijia maritima]|uniref:DUF481 domain-containing protein n=1 Tax=Gaopeijia maritima TaxID=3119007 RepID=UPI00324573CE
MLRPSSGAALVALAALALPLGLAAQDDDPANTRWVFQGEFTSVLSQGNSESFTAGLGTVIRRQWESDALRFEFGGIRTESSRITRRAVGTVDDFVVDVTSDSEKTAESLYARSRYDRTLSERFFAYGAVDWLRNTFAGIESRFLLAAGAGNTWIDQDTQRFKTNYAVTYTIQEDVVERPDADKNFPGARLGWEYWNQLTATSTFDSALLVDLNLSDTDDVRYDLTNSLAVNISEKLALKPSLQFLYRTRPSLASVSLFTAGGEATGDTVLTELEKLDTFFRLALVLTL